MFKKYRDFLWFCFKKKKTGMLKKKYRKNLYDFLWICFKKTYRQFECVYYFYRWNQCISNHVLSILICVYYFYRWNQCISNALIFTITITIFFYLVCIVNFNAFIISIVEINVYQSIDFHDNNNRLFLCFKKDSFL